jgi:TPR repeat protein
MKYLRRGVLLSALVAIISAGGFGWQILRHWPQSRIDFLQLQSFQGMSSASWQLWAAANAGNLKAMLARGQIAIAAKDTDTREQGLGWLRDAAARGETGAALALGRHAFHGAPGMAPDYVAARRWLTPVAKDQAAAAYYLALMDRNGLAGPPDVDHSLDELREAARGGIADAQFLLGNAYQSGDHVARDDSQALQYYHQAATLEHPGALQALAIAFSRGDLGLQTDEGQAKHLFYLAAHALREQSPYP